MFDGTELGDVGLDHFVISIVTTVQSRESLQRSVLYPTNSSNFMFAASVIFHAGHPSGGQGEQRDHEHKKHPQSIPSSRDNDPGAAS